jgi:hypothetical protein
MQSLFNIQISLKDKENMLKDNLLKDNLLKDKTVKEKDEYFIKIHLLINTKHNMLIKKHKNIDQIIKTNEFLREVKDDYVKYTNYIIQQKKEQIIALDLLNKYVDDLRNSGELSKNNIEDAKQEQRKILLELDAIKQNMDDLLI